MPEIKVLEDFFWAGSEVHEPSPLLWVLQLKQNVCPSEYKLLASDDPQLSQGM